MKHQTLIKDFKQFVWWPWDVVVDRRRAVAVESEM